MALNMKLLFALKSSLPGDFSVLGRTRPDYFARKLELKPAYSCDLFNRYSFIPTLPAPKISTVMDTLLSAGVDKRDISNDMWILRHNVDVMRKRLAVASQSKVPMKPWLLRCPDERFQKSVSMYVANVDAKGSSTDTIEYLANRLECSPEDVKEQFAKFPPLEGVSPRKCKHGLDVLFEAGFTPDRILNGLRVLAYSPEKIAERLHILKKHDKFAFLVAPLAWPEKNFCKFHGIPHGSKRANKTK
jgi:hypothetical protein